MFHVAGAPVKVAGTVIVEQNSTLVFDADTSGNFIVSGGGKVIFNGANNPGTSPGRERFEGDVEFSSSAVLGIELAGNSRKRFDQLLVDGRVTLRGTLLVELIGDFVLELGDRFPILTYGSRDGTFDSYLAPQLEEGLMLAQVYGDNELSLVVALAGDVNLDDRVDRVDAALLIANLGKLGGATSSDGDFNGDGDVTLTDLANLQANLGQSLLLPAAGLASVPEPSSLLLAAMGLSLLASCKRWLRFS